MLAARAPMASLSPVNAALRGGPPPSARPRPVRARRVRSTPFSARTTRNVLKPAGALGKGELRSEAERFVEELRRGEDDVDIVEVEDAAALEADISRLGGEVSALQRDIDALYGATFSGLTVSVEGEEGEERFEAMDEATFREVGRSRPRTLSALLAEKERTDVRGWQDFQAKVNALSLKRTRLSREAEDAEAALTQLRRSAAASEWRDELPAAANCKANIVLVSGFESFNVDLYKRAAKRLAEEFPGIRLSVFSDRDLEPRRREVERALESCDIFFGSLLFDYDQVEWLRERISRVPTRLVFESALELMSCTQVGTFEMAPSGKSAGPPPAVKKLLSMFSSGREEDKMVGYLSFLKIGPKLLRFIPGNKARDLKNWLTAYGYWNQGGVDNVVEMFMYLVDRYVSEMGVQPRPVRETPPTGCLHPDHDGYFSGPAEYMKWYRQHGPLAGTDAPVTAVLLYRKHVITNQYYIPQLITRMEAGGLLPLPIFINGVEAHTIVRDQITSATERAALRAGAAPNPTLRSDAVEVDAVVSTLGFPLVGGPAGSMEGGRQADIAKAILSSKNVPYFVAAPLLIQDMESWSRDGIAGLQSVVLYSLPELDGAIDTVPLGGLVANNIHLCGERVERLVNRVKKWVDLRRTATTERKLAVLLYGFPPGVGATGTAALLNVPKSLEKLLTALHSEGYDLGDAVGSDGEIDGEAIISALKAQEEQRGLMGGAQGVNRRFSASGAAAAGFESAAAEMSPARLRELLRFPDTYGPSDWGPIPFLPEPDILVERMERQWGRLESYRGISTSAAGNFVIPGIQCGKVWIGVQPLLGVEGDPMRLLFERDLTPHPQYAAFYKWLQFEYRASAVLHFGMHGTVEWLPGAPLGNTGISWSDTLLGNLPNVYVYACNNPSESIIAKRRGYGTIISHNVPPYGRAGLYKQLATLRELLAEYRESPESNDGLRPTIVENLELAGLQEDCPFAVDAEGEKVILTAESAEEVSAEAFLEFAGRLYAYLSEVEGRLFSEGLHVLGQPPAAPQMAQYLSAYFDGGLPEAAVEAVASHGAEGLPAVRASLEAAFAASPAEKADVDEAKLTEAMEIRGLLSLNTEEIRSTLRALNGEFVPPEAGGDLLRDGSGVLPTGRNIHALDPYRMPSAAALKRGSAAAAGILDAHLEANEGAYPETVAVNLWGLDAIKTKGESVAIALYLVGAVPVSEGTGRVARFELLPLDALDGRPRVDVLCNMSGIFRDSFQNVVELLDDLFRRAAQADEPAELNYVRKHALDMEQQGLGNTSARLFSNPAGDFGSMVNERVGASDWESGKELGDTWASRNAFSYGRGSERGTARPEVLQALLSTTQRVVQEIDSVEYGLTDIQEYYANTGALKSAAENAQAGKKVGCSIVETFGRDPKPRELESVLRLEYRSKLLNPKWAEAMAAQGSGGAYEISQRMTAMVGWGATTGFAEDWTWEQAAETYVMDEAMAAKLRDANPQAFNNILKRMIEASGRGLWNADASTLDRLKELYADMDDQLEGVRG